MQSVVNAKRNPSQEEGLAAKVIWSTLAGVNLVVNLLLSVATSPTVPFAIGQAVMFPLLVAAIAQASPKMRTLGKTAMVFLVVSFILTISLLGDLGSQAAQMTPQARVAATVSEMEDQLPTMVAENQEMTAVFADEAVLVTEIRMTDVVLADLDQAEAKRRIRSDLLDRLCANMDLFMEVADDGIRLRHRYMDMDGAFITEVEIGPDDCP